MVTRCVFFAVGTGCHDVRPTSTVTSCVPITSIECEVTNAFGTFVSSVEYSFLFLTLFNMVNIYESSLCLSVLTQYDKH
jgi:hypothetical protein